MASLYAVGGTGMVLTPPGAGGNPGPTRLKLNFITANFINTTAATTYMMLEIKDGAQISMYTYMKPGDGVALTKRDCIHINFDGAIFPNRMDTSNDGTYTISLTVAGAGATSVLAVSYDWV